MWNLLKLKYSKFGDKRNWKVSKNKKIRYWYEWKKYSEWFSGIEKYFEENPKRFFLINYRLQVLDDCNDIFVYCCIDLIKNFIWHYYEHISLLK